jgi:hypothetical protein
MIGNRSRSGPNGGPGPQILSTVWNFSSFSADLQNLYSPVRIRSAPPTNSVSKSLRKQPPYVAVHLVEEECSGAANLQENTCFWWVPISAGPKILHRLFVESQIA